MSEETEIGSDTLDSSSETIELRIRQELEIDTSGTETSPEELTLRLVDKRRKQATDPIFRQEEEFCARLAGPTEMESTDNKGVIMSLLAHHKTGRHQLICKTC